jgi:Heavy metal binding domain
MAKKICGAVAFGATVMLVLTFAELPSTSAIHDQDQRPGDRQAAGQHHRAARQRVKTRKKENRRRRVVHYVCPMHPDIRSKSHGTCPKCLMNLVAEKRGAKAVRH